MKVLFAAASAAFVVCAGAWGQEASFDPVDGMVTVDGERRFIIGSYYAGTKYAPERPMTEAYDELAASGFNVVHAAPDNIELAHRSGLMTWTTVGSVDLAKLEESGAAIAAAVDRVKGLPGLLMIETTDEPAWTWMKAEARVAPEPLIATYGIIKERAPGKLVYMNQGPTNLVETLRRYNDSTDVTAVDIYPVNPGGLKHSYALFEDGHQGDLNNLTIGQTGEYTDKMRRVVGPNRPLFMVLQAFAWEMLTDEAERREEKILYPSYAETRFMAYQSIVHGANGILYWGSYFTPQPSDAWSNILRVASELGALDEVLAAPSKAMAVEVGYHEIGHSVDDGVRWIAKEVEGATYLIAVNEDRYPAKATLSGLEGFARAVVVDEDREVAVEGGALTDMWKRFDVHVYRLEK